MKKYVSYRFEDIDYKRFKRWMKFNGIKNKIISNECNINEADVSNIITGKKCTTPSFVLWCEERGYSLEPHEMTFDEALGMIDDNDVRMAILNHMRGVKV